MPIRAVFPALQPSGAATTVRPGVRLTTKLRRPVHPIAVAREPRSGRRTLVARCLRALCRVRDGRGLGRRYRHAQFRQRRHRGGRQGDRRDHRAQFPDRSAGQGQHQHHFGAARAEEPRLPHAAVGAAPAGIRRRRRRWRGQDRARGRRQAAGRLGRRGADRGGRRSAGHPGHPAQVRIGGSARQRAAAAHHAEQHDRGLSRQQCARHHGLRRQPEAHRPDHRLARSGARCRTDPGAAQERVGARRRGAPQPPAGRAWRDGAGSDRRAAARDDHGGSALEQRAGARRQSGPAREGAPADRATGHAGTGRRQHVHRLPQERRGRARRADAARDAGRRRWRRARFRIGVVAGASALPRQCARSPARCPPPRR